jgi:hypothetical protein
MKTTSYDFKASLAHMPMGRYGDPENDNAPAVLTVPIYTSPARPSWSTGAQRLRRPLQHDRPLEGPSLGF